MRDDRRSVVPPAVACLLLLAAVPSGARADVVTTLTVHEVEGGIAVSRVDACAVHVHAIGLAAETGTILILAGGVLGTPIASAPWRGTMNADGLVDVWVGPIAIEGVHTGLYPVADHAEEAVEDVVGAAFDLRCEPARVPCTADFFLPPLGTPGHDRDGEGQRFKHGQTLPVKVRLACPVEASALLAPRLFVSPAVGGQLLEERHATTRASSTQGNHLRENGNHWHYDLDTSSLAPGLWCLRVETGDGAAHQVFVDLR